MPSSLHITNFDLIDHEGPSRLSRWNSQDDFESTPLQTFRRGRLSPPKSPPLPFGIITSPRMVSKRNGTSHLTRKPATSRSSQPCRMATGAAELVQPAPHSRDIELLTTLSFVYSILVECVTRVDHPLCDLTVVLLNDVLYSVSWCGCSTTRCV